MWKKEFLFLKEIGIKISLNYIKLFLQNYWKLSTEKISHLGLKSVPDGNTLQAS